METDYLKREAIPDVIYEIGNERISVISGSTSFINISKIHPIALCEFKDLEKEIALLRKSAKCVVRISGLKEAIKFAKDNYKSYLEMIEQYNTFFNETSRIAKLLEIQKIRYGCDDDHLLKEFYSLSSKSQQIYYRSSLVSKIEEMHIQLKNICRDLTYIDSDTAKLTFKFNVS
jgi:hypothetical protein